MTKLLFAAACSLAMMGCTAMPQQDKQSASEENAERVYATGSMLPRKAPKAAPPESSQAGNPPVVNVQH